jgi:hypothetical protein
MVVANGDFDAGGRIVKIKYFQHESSGGVGFSCPNAAVFGMAPLCRRLVKNSERNPGRLPHRRLRKIHAQKRRFTLLRFITPSGVSNIHAATTCVGSK